MESFAWWDCSAFKAEDKQSDARLVSAIAIDPSAILQSAPAYAIAKSTSYVDIIEKLFYVFCFV